MPGGRVAAGVGAPFGKQFRVRTPAEFSAVLARRRSLRSDHFILSYAPNVFGTARLGLVVGRRTLKTAVGRNRIKRLAREAFRLVCPHLPAMDLVLRLAAPLQEVQRGALRSEIETLLAKLAQ